MCKVWVKYTESNLFNCMKLWGKEKHIMNRFRILDDCSGRWLKWNQLFTEQNNGKNKSRILLNLSKQKIATLLSNSSKIMGNSCVSMLYEAGILLLDDTGGVWGHCSAVGRAGLLPLAEMEQFPPGSEAGPHGSSVLGLFLKLGWSLRLQSCWLNSLLSRLQRLQTGEGFSVS